MEITPEDKSDLAHYSNSLGNNLQKRFERFGILDGIEEAIRLTRKAVEITPEDDTRLANYLNSLGNRISKRFE